MMGSHTKRLLVSALDELKRDGYMVLIIAMDKKSDESLPMGSAMEVICSETNDPKIIAAMAKNTLKVLSDPCPNPEPVN